MNNDDMGNDDMRKPDRHGADRHNADGHSADSHNAEHNASGPSRNPQGSTPWELASAEAAVTSRRPRRSVRRRAASVVATVTVAALALSGCVTAFLPGDRNGGGSSTSTPVAEDVAADLKPFYEQTLTWKSCEGGELECTTFDTPENWDEPSAGSVEIAAVRSRATGSDRVGSLLVNPGGPGGSGYDFVADSLDFATDQKLQESFDVVGFDPRGVGRSTPVTCFDPEGLDAYLYDIPANARGTEAWQQESAQSATDFGKACADNTGEFLHYVNTVQSAHDMDLLRALVGDSKLYYLGYSYGTFLGATYAELFPDKVGRLVLDGAIDPSVSNFEVTKTQSIGFENALKAYLESCLAGSDCPFTGSVDQAMAQIRALLESVDTTPIRNSDGRMLGSGTLVTAIIYPLYSQSSWSYLTQMFDDVMKGSASVAFTLADGYNGRNPDGTYADNSTESFTAYNCLDYTYDADPAVMAEQAAEIEKAAPVIGSYMTYGDIGCANWPYTDGAERAPINAPGAPPIMVVGTTNDPATPYEWAVSLADQLESGFLLTYEGEGHTGYNKGSDCVNDAVDDYLVNGTALTSDPKCT